MKKFSCELQRDGYTAKYIVSAETKEEAIKRIKQISGENVTKVKENSPL